MTDSHERIDANLAPVDPSEETRAAIRAAVEESLEPVRALGLQTRVLLVAAAGVLALLVAVSSFGASGVGSLGLGEAPCNVQGCVAAIVVALTGTLALGISFNPSWRSRVAPRDKVALVAMLVAAWTFYVLAPHAGGGLGALLAVDGFAFGCGARALGAGLVAGGLMTWIWRRADPWTPRESGALIGAAAGCIGAAGVGIPCASAHIGHLAIGHWIVVPVLAIVGALMARRTLAP